jgi:hypothetical protein
MRLREQHLLGGKFANDSQLSVNGAISSIAPGQRSEEPRRTWVDASYADSYGGQELIADS